MPDPYALLGLPPRATPDEIRAAYRRLAAERHPDANPPDKKTLASEQMVELNAARDLLLDAARRSQYDSLRPPDDFYQPRPRRPRWPQRIPAGRMFVFATLFIVALPYLWLLASMGLGATTGFVAGLFGTVQCFSSAVIAVLVTAGLAAFLTTLVRALRR